MSIATQIQRLQEAKADIKEAIENKGVAVSSSLTISDYAPLIDSIPTGTTEVESKDVDFYDYDGTRLYSYTKQEFLALNEMPQNPTHDGLISQGWNWTLSGAKNHLATYDYLDIGQLYITDDGATRIYVDLDDANSLSPSVMVAINGSMVIDWGDGSTSNVSGTNINTEIATQHTYASTGNYVVRLIPQTVSTAIRLRGTTAGGSNLFRISENASMQNVRYLSKIYKIELGSNIELNYYAFSYMLRLKSITMPLNQKASSLSALIYNCSSLRHISLPNFEGAYTEFSNIAGSCTSLQSIAVAENLDLALSTFPLCYSLNRFPFAMRTNGSTFNNALSLKEAFISSNSTEIGSVTFRLCYSLSKIHIPSGITSIGANAFNSCLSMRKYDFTKLSQVPTLSNTNAFGSIQSDCKIVVPDSLYDTWIIATNWSNYASYIVKESEYVG